MQPDSAGMSRDLPLGQGLCECICGHVISGAISKCDGSIVDGLPDEMVTDIDMLYAGVIIVINREPDCSLIVAVEGGWQGRDGE